MFFSSTQIVRFTIFKNNYPSIDKNIAILIHLKYNVVHLRMIYVKSWFLQNRRPSPPFLKPLILIFVEVGKNAINSLLFVLISPNSANKTFIL